jgi:hypothetical protein
MPQWFQAIPKPLLEFRNGFGYEECRSTSYRGGGATSPHVVELRDSRRMPRNGTLMDFLESLT